MRDTPSLTTTAAATLAHQGRILCVDVDGTLCLEQWPGFGPANTALIDALRVARERMGWYIIVNSARPTDDYDALVWWLAVNQVPYDQVALGVKPRADVYIDDRGWLPTPDDLLAELERRSYLHTTYGTRDDLMAYYDALASEKLSSPFARNAYAWNERDGSATRHDDANFRVLLPLTGGMDSLTLYQMARESGVPYELYYFDFGQPYAAHEQRAVLDLARKWGDVKRLHVIHLPMSYATHGHVLSGRNAIILMELARYGKVSGWWGQVWFGAVAGETSWRGGDKSYRFLRDLATLLPAGWTIQTPLIGMEKSDLVRYWLARPRGLETLRGVKSCFSADVWACGHCQACFRRWVALHGAGVALDTIASFFPGGVDFAAQRAKYADAMRDALATRDYTHWSPSRMSVTLAAFDALDTLDTLDTLEAPGE